MLVLQVACNKQVSEKETIKKDVEVAKVQENKQDQPLKENKYVVDDTTEVLIDAELKKEDIVRVYQHGDHWHVFTKDGREYITYMILTSLKLIMLFSFVSVVSLDKLKNLPVKKDFGTWGSLARLY